MNESAELAQNSKSVGITYVFDPIVDSWWVINKISDSGGIAVRLHVYEESLFIAISRRKEKR